VNRDFFWQTESWIMKIIFSFINSPKLLIMFLQLAHTKPGMYKFSRELAIECYRITNKFPSSEKFAMVQQ